MVELGLRVPGPQWVLSKGQLSSTFPSIEGADWKGVPGPWRMFGRPGGGMMLLGVPWGQD